MKNGANKGSTNGYPFSDFEVTIFDGSIHKVDSSELDFKLAGEEAIKKAMLLANPVTLEPLMKLEVNCPEENFGTVIGLISSLKGFINDTKDQNGSKIILSEVPLQNLFGFTNSLRGQTQGRANSTMEFSRYAIYTSVPKLRNKM